MVVYIAVCISFLEMDEEYNPESKNCIDSAAGITLVDFWLDFTNIKKLEK